MERLKLGGQQPPQNLVSCLRSVSAMYTNPLIQAQGRLQLCERALTHLNEQNPDFLIHWLDFLVQWKGTYMKVQQAAKSNAKELQWFGGLNSFRRSDPLLRYLYEARNADEHNGLVSSATDCGGMYEFKLLKKGPFQARVDFGDPNGLRMVDKATGQVVGELARATIEVGLQAVPERDRRKLVPVPTSHLGNPIAPNPIEVASLGYAWLKSLVDSASELHRCLE